MKKTLTLLLSLIMVISTLCVTGVTISAETYSGSCGDDLTWTLDTRTSVLNIAGTGDMYDYEFDESPWYSYRSYIRSVIISDSVTSIGDSAFNSCEALTNVSIGNSVTSIGVSAISGCKSLTAITIPDSVVYLGECVLSSCESLETVDIGSSVSQIGSSAFLWCYALENINVDSGNSKFISIDGILYTKNKSVLLRYPSGRTAGVFTIPDTVTEIGHEAFDDASSLTSVVIPDSVTDIGDGAFRNCRSLESIDIPDSVDNIGTEAFRYCYTLEYVSIGNSVRNIGDFAFDYCEALTGITIPNSVHSIGASAFKRCYSLTSATLGKSLLYIGVGAFFDCRSLVFVDIYDSVNRIDDDAFVNCLSLENITIPSLNVDIGDNVFCAWNRYEGYTLLDIEIRCYKDSAPHAYAVKEGLSFDLIGDVNFVDSFVDVKESHWFYSAVRFVVNKGYMNGMSETSFSPNSNITREQFVLILANIAGVDTNEFKYTESGFTDVKTGQWYSGAVTWAVQEGYVSGMSPTEFGRGKNITRGQLARLIYVFAEKGMGLDVIKRADISDFADADLVNHVNNAWMKAPIEWAVAEGIISGMEIEGKLSINPNGTATRAQAAVMLQRFDVTVTE